MADRSRILKLNILAETKDLVKGLDKANQEVSGAGEKIGAAFKKVAVVAAAAAAAVGVFAIKLGKDSIKAAIEAESQQNRLRQILLATGAATEAQIKALDRQANALEKVGVVSAGNIKVAQSQLATFDLQATTIQKLTPAILDYVTAEKGATASSEDFKSMTNGLAQALQGNFASLTRTGFVLDENTKNLIKNGTETERAAALVEVLNSTYKGFNQTLAQTTEGRLQQLRNNFERIKETIGGVLLPVFNEMVKFIADKILPIIDSLVARFERDANPAINKMREIITNFVLPALNTLWLFIRDYIIPIFQNLLKPAIDIIVIGFKFLVDIIKDNKAGFEVYLGILQRVWSFIRDQLAPILGGALATAFNLLFRVVGDVINAFLKFFELIGKVASLVGIDLKLSLDKATTSTNNLNTGTVEAYKNFSAQSKGIKDQVIPAVDGLTKSYNNMTSASDGATKSTKALTAAKKELSSLEKELAALQAGGALPSKISPDLKNFYRSELSLISQYGGFIEGINLKPGDPFFGFGRGGNVGAAINQRQSGSATATGNTVNVNVNGTVLDPEGTARALEELIKNAEARGGNLFDVLVGISP
jgi:hypothetical protein